MDIHHRTRKLALIVPSSNTILEPLATQILLPLLASHRLSLHFTRIRVTTLSTSPEARAQFAPEAILPAASLLADLHPDAILWGGTAGLWSTAPLAAEQALVQSMESSTLVPSSTTTIAFISALKFLGYTKIGLATPYSAGLTGRMSDFFKDNGIDVVKVARLNPPCETNLEIAETGAEEIEDIVFAAAGHESVQAVVVGCTNWAGAPGVDVLERETGKVVLDSVIVTIWFALRMMGFRKGIKGWGLLLEKGLAVANDGRARSKSRSRRNTMHKEVGGGLGDIKEVRDSENSRPNTAKNPVAGGPLANGHEPDGVDSRPTTASSQQPAPITKDAPKQARDGAESLPMRGQKTTPAVNGQLQQALKGVDSPVTEGQKNAPNANGHLNFNGGPPAVTAQKTEPYKSNGPVRQGAEGPPTNGHFNQPNSNAHPSALSSQPIPQMANNHWSPIQNGASNNNSPTTSQPPSSPFIYANNHPSGMPNGLPNGQHSNGTPNGYTRDNNNSPRPQSQFQSQPQSQSPKPTTTTATRPQRPTAPMSIYSNEAMHTGEYRGIKYPYPSSMSPSSSPMGRSMSPSTSSPVGGHGHGQGQAGGYVGQAGQGQGGYGNGMQAGQGSQRPNPQMGANWAPVANGQSQGQQQQQQQFRGPPQSMMMGGQQGSQGGQRPAAAAGGAAGGYSN